MPATEAQAPAGAVAYSVVYRDGRSETAGDGPPVFTLHVSDDTQLRRVLSGDDYSVAMAFVRGEFDVSGDLISALRFKLARSRPSLTRWIYSAAMRLAPARIETWFQSRARAARNVRFHYDRSNDFYRMFLDSRLVYSEGYFGDAGWSLEQAQEAKLDSICKDLDLRPGEKFLDVGCGWGALVVLAAEQYGAHATGCTLSRSQCAYASSLIESRELTDRAKVREVDYRDLSGRFDKIASIAMFEQVGRHRLGAYFRHVYGLLADGGRFLNSGITRPQPVRDDPQSWFLLRRVFPGGELAHLSDVVREAENVGFEILKAESVRKHYALTCRAWVDRLRRNTSACINLVGQETYRTWLLYLAASALNFETGETDVQRVLMAKRGR